MEEQKRENKEFFLLNTIIYIFSMGIVVCIVDQ